MMDSSSSSNTTVDADQSTLYVRGLLVCLTMLAMYACHIEQKWTASQLIGQIVIFLVMQNDPKVHKA